MLRGNYNDGNTYKMSIPQYISMKISDEPLLFVGGAFSYDMGNIHEFYRPIHIPRKKNPDGTLFGQRGSSLMLWGNGNSGNTYKISIPRYISMKISDETLLFVGGAFAYALGMRNNELHNNAIFFDKHPDGTLFSAEGIFRLCSVDALPIQGIYGRYKKKTGRKTTCLCGCVSVNIFYKKI